MKKLILLVEDNIKIRNFICATLENTEYTYITASKGKEAIDIIREEKPDITILDLGLPDIDGIEVIKKVREFYSNPIIILSARNEDKDKVTALDYGADDYLTKPFSIDELLARIRVAFRRVSLSRELKISNDIFINGNLKIIYSSNEVCINDTKIHLTPIEYNLIVLLSKNVGKVLTHNFILKEIWGTIYESDMLSLRVFMAGLRKKLKNIVPEQQYIQTHVAVGYKMIRIEN
ncbi:MAG: response regulator transcription factor [Fusobacteriaceae bacterium]